jgi:hypothetical protein
MHIYLNFFVYFVIFVLNNHQFIQTVSANVVASGKQPEVVDSAMADFKVRREALDKARKELEREKEEFENEKRIMEKFLKDSEVVQFNCGGEIMYTTRASVLRVADSKMGKILLEKTSEKVSIDKDGNRFLDFNPSLCRHMLEQLRLFEDGESIVFYPPLTPVLTVQFNAMLKQLGLEPAPPSPDDIFTFNVGDEIIATKRKTLERVPNSKLSTLLTMNKPSDMDPKGYPFLDYDPKLFRHLLTQLHAGQTRDFEAPNDESKAAFNVLLKNLGLTPK